VFGNVLAGTYKGRKVDLACYEVHLWQALINDHVPWVTISLSHSLACISIYVSSSPSIHRHIGARYAELDQRQRGSVAATTA